MDWKDFFKLSVIKEGPSGGHPYFHSELKVPENFSMEELLIKEFDHLELTPQEKKHLTINHRKILLRERYFHCAEFERIVLNFLERLAHEKDQELTFSTSGGGIYLFVALLKHPEVLKEKKLICYTSEFPLLNAKFSQGKEPNLVLIHKKEAPSYFKNLPTLWQSPL
ncbi:hypothetical protein [Peredibacter starrii]|uniref:DUF1788 domain-containing protein n=1 Tax=Peredibacter starrii TaxID=28202 RepID=A0AAX4HLA0_9BACT|nr:hypothetical protein [Peredibacter starrii]WPU64062.1 hypothetical protein SOO65_15300 [Peredibacter starrii]